MAEEKEPFISSQERPVMGLHPDTPISQLRVRDLQTLLQGATYNNKQWPETKDNTGKPEKNETKDELKEWKGEGKEGKNEKNEKPEKPEKYEKDEKNEGKNEGKGENSEGKTVVKDATKYEYEIRYFNFKQSSKENETHSSGRESVNPAAIDQLIRSISGLSEQVTNLTQEVKKLKRQSNEGQTDG